MPSKNPEENPDNTFSILTGSAISLRLLLRPPVSHTLTHTRNQLNQIINKFGGCSRASSHLFLSWWQGGGGVQGKTPNSHSLGGTPCFHSLTSCTQPTEPPATPSAICPCCPLPT